MHFSQPKVSVGIQEVIINFVPKEKDGIVIGREQEKRHYKQEMKFIKHQQINDKITGLQHLWCLTNINEYMHEN